MRRGDKERPHSTPPGVDQGRRQLIFGAVAGVVGIAVGNILLSSIGQAHAAGANLSHFDDRRNKVNIPSPHAYQHEIQSQDIQNTPRSFIEVTNAKAELQITPTPNLQATKTALDIKSEELTIQKQQTDDTFAFLTDVVAPISTIIGIVALIYTIYKGQSDREIQVRTGLQQQKDERFQNALAGLGSSSVDARATSAYMFLTFLEQEGYERFHKQIFNLAVFHFRTRPVYQDKPNIPDALDQAFLSVFLKAIKRLQDTLLSKKANVEEYTGVLNAENIHLDNMYLGEVDLSYVKLSNATFTDSILMNANLTNADLTGANLTNAVLNLADLTKADLLDADLTGANPQAARSLEGSQMILVNGLSKRQIAECKKKNAKIGDDEVLTLVEKILPNIDHYTAYYLKGNALLNLGRHEEALDAYKQALFMTTKDPKIYNNIGIVFKNLGRYEEALDAYEQALFLDPGYVLACGNKGYALFKLKRYEEALATYDQVLLQNSKYAEAYNGKGVVFIDGLQKYGEALDLFNQALRLESDNVHYNANKGYALFKLKRYEEALAAYDQALHYDPQYIDAYQKKGAVLLALGEYDEALAAFDQALRLEPDNALYNNSKGFALYQLKRYEEALAAYDQALHSDPTLVLAYTNKGKVFMDLQKYDEALAAFDQSLKLDQKNNALMIERGKVLIALERYNEVLEITKIALSLNPENEPLQAVIKELEIMANMSKRPKI